VKERWEAEIEERKRTDEIKERELQLMEQRNDAERERRDSAAMKGTLFGDAMRSAAINMSSYLQSMRFLTHYRLFLCDHF